MNLYMSQDPEVQLRIQDSHITKLQRDFFTWKNESPDVAENIVKAAETFYPGHPLVQGMRQTLDKLKK